MRTLVVKDKWKRSVNFVNCTVCAHVKLLSKKQRFDKHLSNIFFLTWHLAQTACISLSFIGRRLNNNSDSEDEIGFRLKSDLNFSSIKMVHF